MTDLGPLPRECNLCGTRTPQSYAVRLETYPDGSQDVVYCTKCRTLTASRRGYATAFMFDTGGFIDWDDHFRGGMHGAEAGDRRCEACRRPMAVEKTGVKATWVCYIHPYALPE